MRIRSFVATAILPIALVACGGSSKTGQQTTNARPAATTSPATTSAGPAKSSTVAAAPSLQAEATSAAAGDIPDNQVFLSFDNPAAGYSIRYPEGWAQSGSGAHVTFRDKNNIVRVVVTPRAATPMGIRHDLSTLARARGKSGPEPRTIGGRHAYKVVYSTESAPNPVTGKRVTLVVDRYYVTRPGKEAILDLGTPQGVDNVDAYRLIAESFRWK